MGSPEVVRRQLGLELERLREAVSMTQAQAAELIGADQSRVSRIESGRRAATLAELKILLEAYSADGDVRAELLDLAGAAKKPNWWGRRFGGTAVPEYARSFTNLERGAAEKWWYAETMPGLLQTEAVTRELFGMSTELFGLEPMEVDRLIKVRLARQEILTREPNPLQLHAVINEAVLHRPIGTAAVMRAQLLHLVEMARQPNITVRILPFAAGKHPAMGVTFELLRFPGQAAPEIVYEEGINTSTIHDDAEDVSRHKLVFDRVSEAALGAGESLELIAAVADQYLSVQGQEEQG